MRVIVRSPDAMGSMICWHPRRPVSSRVRQGCSLAGLRQRTEKREASLEILSLRLHSRQPQPGGDALYFLFLDESGTPPNSDKAEGKYLVIGGVIIPEGAWHGVAKDFAKATANVLGELKWKYFGTGNKENSLSHLEPAEKEQVRTDVFRAITSRKAVKLICCVTSVEAAYKRPTIVNQDDVYHLTYKGVTERFQYFLQDAQRVTGQPQFGIVVSDHRMSNDDAKLRKRHHELLEGSDNFVSNYANVIETIFFSPSDASVGLQLADMVAGAVHRSFQAGENRFAEAIKGSFRTSPQGKIAGFGLVRMPLQTFIAPAHEVFC